MSSSSGGDGRQKNQKPVTAVNKTKTPTFGPDSEWKTVEHNSKRK